MKTAVKILFPILLFAFAIGGAVWLCPRTAESLSYEELRFLLSVPRAICLGIAIKMLYDVWKN